MGQAGLVRSFLVGPRVNRPCVSPRVTGDAAEHVLAAPISDLVPHNPASMSLTPCKVLGYELELFLVGIGLPKHRDSSIVLLLVDRPYRSKPVPNLEPHGPGHCLVLQGSHEGLLGHAREGIGPDLSERVDAFIPWHLGHNIRELRLKDFVLRVVVGHDPKRDFLFLGRGALEKVPHPHRLVSGCNPDSSRLFMGHVGAGLTILQHIHASNSTDKSYKTCLVLFDALNASVAQNTKYKRAFRGRNPN